MKFLRCRILCIFLALAVLLSAPGCQPATSEKQQGTIKIEKDPAYSEETLMLTEQTAYSLMLYAYRSAITNKISEKTEARLKSFAGRISEIITAKPIPEDKYLAVTEMLANDGEGVIDELIALQNDEAVTYEKTRELYLELTYAFGAEHASSMAYDVCILIYDMCYEIAMERFDTYQYPWYKEEAEEWTLEKTIFTEGVGRESFAALIKCGSAMAELLEESPEEISGIFSDAEILEILRHLDFSEINVTAEGWEILLSHSLTSNGNPYFAKFIDVFKSSGDISRASAVMSDAVRLTESAMEKLLPGDIAAFRKGAREEFLTSVFSRFDETDWSLFTSATSVSLANKEYSALAEEKYGEAYLEYMADIEPIDAETLRASIGGEDFYKCLCNYFAGISPAISYEVNS